MAALALLAVGVWVRNGLGKNAMFLLAPMAFMFVTTVAALVLLIKTNLGNPLLAGISAVLLVLALLLVKEGWGALQRKPGEQLQS